MGDRLSLVSSCVYGDDDAGRLSEWMRLSRKSGIPLLATNGVHYHTPERRMLQDVLTCVRHGCTIHEAGFRLFPNGERYLKSPGQMQRLFADYPRAIRRGIEIAERCTFSLDELRYEYPNELVPAGMSAIEHLTKLAWQGAAERYPGGIPEKVRRLIEHELTLIEQLKYEAYFLTVYDLVKFARARGILCQGRGSAANSAVCYCIGITSVDPARIDLLFERFISAARNEPPDIDVDFEHERREEVLQYIYEKYGRERAGMTAEVISYRGRSAVRDVGKALGLSLDLVDQMAKKLDWWQRGSLSETQLRELGLDPKDPAIQGVVDLVSQLLGFPRHLSQHVGGMVMTRGPLCELVPIENASMDNRTVIEWDKDDIDALGILKVDVLALGMLTCISKAFRLINERALATDEHRCTQMRKNLASSVSICAPSVANQNSSFVSSVVSLLLHLGTSTKTVASVPF
jgi:error-prone DNA polymerase